MTREELVAFMRAKCDEMIQTIQEKNHDYTGGSSDPFFNFRAVELLDVTDTETGMLTRLTDKFMRVRSFVKLGILKVKSESVVDTLVDAAAYNLLLAGVVEAKRRKLEQKAPVVKKSMYCFEKSVGGPVIYGSAEHRAEHEWVMLFQDPKLDCIRAETIDKLLAKAKEQHGGYQLCAAS